MLGMTTFPFACVKVKMIIKLPDSHIINFLVLIDFVKDSAVICKFQPGKAQMKYAQLHHRHGARARAR